MAFTERLAILISANDAASSTFRSIGAAAKGELGQAEKSVVGVSGKMKQLGLDSVGLSSVMKVALPAAALATAAGIVAMGVKGVESFISLTDQARQFQRVSGATAEQASGLASIMRRLGVDTDVGALAIFRMAKNVATTGDKLQGFGVAIAHDASGNTDLFKTLENVSDAYSGMQDPAQRAALVQAAFGRGGQALIPILEQGRDGITQLFDVAKAHGEVFNQADIDRGLKFKLAMHDLGAEAQKLERDLGAGLVPVIVKVVGALEKGASGISKFIDWLDRGKVHTNAVSDAVDAQLDDFLNLADGVDAVTQAMQDDVDALNKVVDAQQRMEDSTNSVATAQQKLADDKAWTNAREVSDAENAVTTARRGQERATRSLADAQDRLNALRRQDPARIIAEAQNALNDVTQSAAEAQDNLNRLRDIGASPREIAAATNALADAQAAAADAQDVYNQKVADGGNRSEIAQAEQDVADAQDNVHTAAQAAADAQDKLNAARKDNRAKEIAADERELNKAIEAQSRAAQDLATAQGSTLPVAINAAIAALQAEKTAIGNLDPSVTDFINHRIAELQQLLGTSPTPPLTGGAAAAAVAGGTAGHPSTDVSGILPPGTPTGPAPPPSNLGNIFAPAVSATPSPDYGPGSPGFRSEYSMSVTIYGPRDWNEVVGKVDQAARLKAVTRP